MFKKSTHFLLLALSSFTLVACGTIKKDMELENTIPFIEKQDEAETEKIADKEEQIPYVAFEYKRTDDSSDNLFINIDEADLRNQDVYVYVGSYEDNLEKIENEFNDPDFLLADVAKDSMNEIDYNDIGNHEEYTVVATKFISTSKSPIESPSLYKIPHFDIKELGTKDLSFLFNGAENFNQDISHWDVSNVEDMGSLFDNVPSFTSDLSSWDVSNVEDMDYMFNNAKLFTSDLSNWDVSNVEYMSDMFNNATSFTSDLSNWDVSNVEYYDNFENYSKLTQEQLPHFNR